MLCDLDRGCRGDPGTFHRPLWRVGRRSPALCLLQVEIEGVRSCFHLDSKGSGLLLSILRGHAHGLDRHPPGPHRYSRDLINPILDLSADELTVFEVEDDLPAAQGFALEIDGSADCGSRL